ncbi:pyridoxamine 5'-phosphate oxidase family protein [Aureimonas populi]|uniref:Pyridoxamine 5'-phosphate oxidase family protein n=1 Tax=Aureimonas populi TaxID=1701758 RepID=A0ABW5CPT7_9HYPH|nr:pyridoxamine 5'-phosphate oxidase family protein [Aureimonas populi]
MADDTQKFWELLKEFDTCMVVTRDGQRLRGRPMAPKAGAGGEILFVTEKDTHKVDEIERDNQVACTFTRHGQYLAVSGTARVSTDRALIDEAWDAEVEAWMPQGKDGPNVAVLAVDPRTAELWDVKKNAVARAWELAKAYAGDKDRPDVGRHETLRP